jgi:hypothetical protein
MLLAALLLAGCENKAKLRAEFIQADKAVAAPAVLTHFALNTPDAKTELTLPAGIDRYPELHAKLFTDGKQELMNFTKTAAGDRARYALKGVKHAGPYERRVVWTITAVTPRLIGLRDAWFDDTGGAHPDHGSEVLLWDRVHNAPLLKSELFKPELDKASLDDRLCRAATRAKEARVGPTDPKSWSCPTWSDAKAVLVPSTQPYRIGGLMFLFDPFTIGAYAEGDYEVLIPLSDFQTALAPAWTKDFVGAPAPTVRPRR